MELVHSCLPWITQDRADRFEADLRADRAVRTIDVLLGAHRERRARSTIQELHRGVSVKRGRLLIQRGGYRFFEVPDAATVQPVAAV